MTISKAIVDNELRMATISALGLNANENFVQTTNQSFKTVMTDANGVERLVEVKIVVGKVEEARTARERLEEECAKWQESKDKKEAQKRERAAKAERDKAARKRKAEEKKAAEEAAAREQ